MTIQENTERLGRVNDDRLIQNLIAQAHSRYILLNTSESQGGFPPYTIQDSNLNILAFYYLDIGCVFAENEDLENARGPIEKGASLLEHTHAAETHKGELSNYYMLISALSYYVAFQYSKSFILIGKIATNTELARLISLFLQRQFDDVTRTVEGMVMESEFKDETIANGENEIENDSKIYLIVVGKALYAFVRYLQSGNLDFLRDGRQNLLLLKEIAELKSEPGIWWVIRLLILIGDGINAASLWNSLSSHFDLQSDLVRKYIFSLVYYPYRGIYELFIAQRKSLEKVLRHENVGCVVTIPTSSGKTRIAELAILNCLNADQNNKVLYIAPFRSLAFEVESSLDRVLGNVNLNVSHLYGTGLFSKLDREIIEESHVLVATPEKAKAIFRANTEIADQIKLIVIDEGHLFGSNDRLIGNEIFYEETRYFIEKNAGRFLLLSAVLPNAMELGLWLNGTEDSVFKDTWRPSDERFGVLEWNGEHVNLDWKNNDENRPSFNNKFITREQLPLKKGQSKVRYFPSNKNEAVAATTFKLRVFGTALIFVGRQDSVLTMADCYLRCLGNNPDDFRYTNLSDWKAYQLASIEAYGNDNNWLLYARKGILCHHGGLSPDVRLPLERLMRSDRPLVIISTSTLGQGVNLGVSTVVFSTTYQGGDPLTKRDFWNIAGRAGRAFVDYEGKVLIALDTSDESNLFKKITRIKTLLPRRFENQKNWIINRQKESISDYLNKGNIDIAYSGILALMRTLVTVAENARVEFDLLLQLISENRLNELSDDGKLVNDALDLIDDTLLSLHNLNNVDNILANFDWVETFFSRSLAYIQIKDTDLTQAQYISLLKQRISGIQNRVGLDRQKWRSIISSGLPLNTDLYIQGKIDELNALIAAFFENEGKEDKKSELALKLVKTIVDAPILSDIEQLKSTNFESLLKEWISGSSRGMFEENGELITDVFTYKFPWLFNGIAKKMRNLEMEQGAELIEEIALLIELGLPSMISIKIYQSGIRSRTAAIELALLFDPSLADKPMQYFKNSLVEEEEFFKKHVSTTCSEWLNLLSVASRSKRLDIAFVRNFRLDEAREYTNTLIAKNINGKEFLVSPDLRYLQNASVLDTDFSQISGVSGVFFKYDAEDNYWKMIVENPYIRIKRDD